MNQELEEARRDYLSTKTVKSFDRYVALLVRHGLLTKAVALLRSDSTVLPPGQVWTPLRRRQIYDARRAEADRLEKEYIIPQQQRADLERLAEESSYPEAAETAWLLINAEIKPEAVTGYQDRIRPMYNFPSGSEAIMLALDIVLETHGVEAHFPESGSTTKPAFEWLNTGDTYSPTIVLRDEDFHITSFGDFLEELESEAEAQDDYSSRPGDWTQEDYERFHGRGP